MLLARSADPEHEIPPQKYADHIIPVARTAIQNAERMLQHYSGDRSMIEKVAHEAAIFHDLGKLDAQNQEALRGKTKRKLPINHVDAGTKYLLDLRQYESALLVYSHHKGLISVPDEATKGNDFLRDTNTVAITNTHLQEYLLLHNGIIKSPNSFSEGQTKLASLTRRLTLSCLVDADHGDAARHSGNEISIDVPLTRWEERLEVLDKYVAELSRETDNINQSESQKERFQIRSAIYSACRRAGQSHSIDSCDAPVGSGKTTAVMAHLLNIAQKKNLRHIIVVLPYTNIIKQSVDIYRKSLVLPGENPDEIVAAHHHQADFSEESLYYLTTLWKTPIIVTTAVQFFETLAHNMPAKLRKLHELPGSAVFVDEAHAAIPAYMWPQVWLWLKELAQNWNCHFTLASGSLARFWKFEEYVNPPENINDIVPDSLRKRAIALEERRIYPKKCENVLNREQLCNFVLSKEGPRLVILNTVQSAAVIANELRKKGKQVFHLSTALSPKHRNLIIEKVKALFRNSLTTDWILVATSCVEAGMDFSFRTAFRESCSVASLIQIAGRVNRHAIWENAEVWDFRVIYDEILTSHPGFENSRNILNDLFGESLINQLSPSELTTEAMRRELINNHDHRMEILKEKERLCDYPRVTELCKIISTDTRLVVVEPEVVRSLESNKHLSFTDIQQNSVQIWSAKIQKLNLRPIAQMTEIYKWNLAYDSNFLGIAAGLLPLIYVKEDGLII